MRSLRVQCTALRTQSSLGCAHPILLPNLSPMPAPHPAGQSVVVCAPTGAGKTAIAEAAAAAVLARGQRVIYTTPLKALSNQKLFEMRARFGPKRVGLQTGDGSLNAGPLTVLHSKIHENLIKN